MRQKLKMLTAITGLVLAIPLAATADENNGQGNTVRESVQVADHFMFGDPPVLVQGATILVRDLAARVITATVTSAALVPHNAYSIWWVVFNRPQYCATPYECAGSDLGNPAVRGSVFWGGGLLADGDGYGNTQIELRRGRTDRELFGPMRDDGLQRLGAAEIHLVLRTHGPAGIAGSVAAQIGTANEACPPGGCQNVFFSVHRAM
ncbi:MAG TPA: hypothetical protein VK854_15965 [Woeseiaceae bacterium]|nr:hypothetical protein [Woeseiaceae bacterium]